MEEKCFENVVERCRYMAQVAKSTVMRNSFTAAADEIEMLRTAISETLDENGHLADGDNCTLMKLKKVMPNAPGKPTAANEPNEGENA